MAARRVSEAEVEKLIERIAQASIKKRGLEVSDAAISELIAPSKKYFKEHGTRITIGEKKLEQQIDSIVGAAAQQLATDGSKLRLDARTGKVVGRITIRDAGTRRVSIPGGRVTVGFGGSPSSGGSKGGGLGDWSGIAQIVGISKRSRRKVERAHVKRAMRKRKCHYLWFC